MSREPGAPPAETVAAASSGLVTCPLCEQDTAPSEFLAGAALDAELESLVTANEPWWRPELGSCRRCADRLRAARREVLAHFPQFARGAWPILPTALRLGGSEAYSGRGVTIAFLDAGFYAHPDLVEPRDRILAYVDLTNPRASRRDLGRAGDSSWHGMMTSVVACGNGRLSGGLYRGLASASRLVLVKCGTVRRVAHDDIRRGLDWVVRHRKRYGIRVVNVSCGGDYEASYLADRLSQSAERATRAGMLVCAAVGNQGHTPNHPVLPPASSPSVLTVGGLDDKNRLSIAGYDMYHSSYGPTVDGLQKPEVIAPGIWVAAPILPGTPTAAQAELLSRLAAAPDTALRATIASSPGIDPDLDAAIGLEPSLMRQVVEVKLRDNNVISGAYKHVDGTSFAAPIVASIAAQMLEANPRLTPQQTKLILIRTARRLPHVSADRQGWGVVDAAAAVNEAVRSREDREGRSSTAKAHRSGSRPTTPQQRPKE
jgi:serine protease AprX